MSMTLGELTGGLRERMGDDGEVDWSDTQLENALKDAMRVAWPYFYEVVADTATYTGSNYVAEDTTELAVPTAFYSVTGIGRITRLDYRRYVSSGTNRYQWVKLRRGVWIDDLMETDPKIHFTATRARGFELEVRGIRPLTIPPAAGSTVAGTDWQGFVVWLYYTAEKFARSARVRANAYDTEAEQQRRILATQEAQEMAEEYRMRPPGLTLFSRW